MKDFKLKGNAFVYVFFFLYLSSFTGKFGNFLVSHVGCGVDDNGVIARVTYLFKDYDVVLSGFRRE